jgi:hypothetical protein
VDDAAETTKLEERVEAGEKVDEKEVVKGEVVGVVRSLV